MLDGDIKAFPQIDYTDSTLSDGIAGGGEIQFGSGTGVLAEAQNLALVLKYGALPIPFKRVEQTNVSATLGKDSLNQAKTAALIALLHRRDLPDRPLPLPRPRRRRSAWRSTWASCTRRCCS